jgi:hypothetical protein
MCLIIVQPKGDVPVSKRDILDAWQDNPDGAGYMFAVDGRLVIRKPFWKAKSLRKAYRQDFRQYGAQSPFVLHFRYATHGPNTVWNTHPHILAGGQVGLVHNGILPWAPTDPSLSDTATFAKDLEGFGQAELMHPEYHAMLAEDIGYNKLVFMDGDGNTAIVKEELGHWDGDRWLSSPAYVSLAGFRRALIHDKAGRDLEGWDEIEEYYGFEEDRELESAWERHMTEEELLKEYMK